MRNPLKKYAIGVVFIRFQHLKLLEYDLVIDEQERYDVKKYLGISVACVGYFHSKTH